MQEQSHFEHGEGDDGKRHRPKETENPDPHGVLGKNGEFNEEEIFRRDREELRRMMEGK